jgi:hypothetical protein
MAPSQNLKLLTVEDTFFIEGIVPSNGELALI